MRAGAQTEYKKQKFAYPFFFLILYSLPGEAQDVPAMLKGGTSQARIIDPGNSPE